eukprot:6500199-Pyramimonas_sp.AAC.1
MLQPTLASSTRQNFEHQESAEARGFSRVGPWEATLVFGTVSILCWVLELLSGTWSSSTMGATQPQ